jgi:hypothetical protein
MLLDVTAVEQLLELEEQRLAFALSSESFKERAIPALEGFRDEIVEEGHRRRGITGARTIIEAARSPLVFVSCGLVQPRGGQRLAHEQLPRLRQ